MLVFTEARSPRVPNDRSEIKGIIKNKEVYWSFGVRPQALIWWELGHWVYWQGTSKKLVALFDELLPKACVPHKSWETSRPKHEDRLPILRIFM